MKKISEELVGGRIRKARMDCNMSIKSLAATVGVSLNHLSLIERGVKNPSLQLLNDIAVATNVSSTWLYNGSDSTSTHTTQGTEQGAEEEYQGNYSLLPDIRLFLFLALGEVPNMSKDTLAAVLNTPPETIDAIFDGQDVKTQPHWGAAFELLARQMDYFKASGKVRGLGAYIERTSRDMRRNPNTLAFNSTLLFESLQRYLEQKDGMSLRMDTYNIRRETILHIQMFLESENRHRREVHFFQSTDLIGGDMDSFVEMQLNDVKYGLKRSGYDCQELLTVIDDKSIYDDFVKKAQEHINKLERIWAMMEDRPYNLTAMLVDQETLDVLDEKQFKVVA